MLGSPTQTLQHVFALPRHQKHYSSIFIGSPNFHGMAHFSDFGSDWSRCSRLNREIRVQSGGESCRVDLGVRCDRIRCSRPDSKCRGVGTGRTRCSRPDQECRVESAAVNRHATVGVASWRVESSAAVTREPDGRIGGFHLRDRSAGMFKSRLCGGARKSAERLKYRPRFRIGWLEFNHEATRVPVFELEGPGFAFAYLSRRYLRLTGSWR